MRTLKNSFAILLGSLTVLTGAGAASSSSPVVSDQAKTTLEAIQSSKALFKSGSSAQAEATLFALNKHAPNTSEWHRDSGRALIGMAAAFHQDGDSVNAGTVAKLALAEINQALSTPGGSAQTRASALALKGYLLQRFSSDRQGAETAFSAAVQLSPATTVHAAAALQRMREEDQSLAYHGIGPDAGR